MRGGTLRRLLGGAAALSLITRGATGFCAMKSALAGETSFKEGVKEQWQRVNAHLGATTREIDSMNALYAIELQELHSAEAQLADLAESLATSIDSAPLALRVDEYAAEVRSRKVDLESLLAHYRADPREHPDDALRALVRETRKMSQVCAPTLRDAALAASLQRIIHYKIASYGTIAAYAKALGRLEQAGHFADLADRDKAVDSELTELAKNTLNPQAIKLEPTAGATTEEVSGGVRH
jgi:ferritin-like metal-binding protein YciE